MKKNVLLKLIASGIFAALVFIMTAIVAVPLPPSGYANLGDCFVILSGLVLGPLYGGAAAGLGSMLADLFLGYTVYAPATFIIKALMAVCSALILSKAHEKGLPLFRIVLAGFISEIIMLAGYFAFESILYGAPTAVATLLGNSMQGAFGLIAATVIYPLLLKSRILELLRFNDKK